MLLDYHLIIKLMKKILFYISIVLSLRLAYVIYDIVIYQLETLNAYGIGFLVGKIVLLLILCLYSDRKFQIQRKGYNVSETIVPH